MPFIIRVVLIFCAGGLILDQITFSQRLREDHDMYLWKRW